MIDESVLEAMHRSFGSSVRRIFLPNQNKRIDFREPNVGEQKTFSKIILANADSQSTLYGATLALIKRLCLDRTFSQYSINELDRIIILANLFSMNFLTKQIHLNCPNKDCKHTFVKNVKHGEILKKLEGIAADDLLFENNNEIGTIRVKVNYPSTRKYLEFLEFVENKDLASESKKAKIQEAPDKYEQLDHAFDDITSNSTRPISPDNKKDDKTMQLIEKRRNVLKKQLSSKAAGNIDIAKLNSKSIGLDSADPYIREISWNVNGDDNDYNVTFDDSITFEETERILAGFPSSFLMKEDGTSLTDFIANSLYQRMYGVVPEIKCPKCGLDLTKNVNLYDFFIAG